MIDNSDIHGSIRNDEDCPDGYRMIAQKITRLPALGGIGRKAFIIDDNVSVGTPSHLSRVSSSSWSDVFDEDPTRDGEHLDFRWPLMSGKKPLKQRRAFDGLA
uniref:Uncharacterized protein n=1 Tax=Alexandrium andersonii TaxID=327968 RepID=A0A7S2CC92_9DINO